jgi:hypothetical protein
MELNPQAVIKTLRDAEHSAANGNWYQVQQGCRQVLGAIAKDPSYAGVIQCEFDKAMGGHRIRIHHGPAEAGYDTWAFHYRWASDAAEFAVFLQELGYEWDAQTKYRNEGEEQLALALLAEERNDELQLERAEWLERNNM